MSLDDGNYVGGSVTFTHSGLAQMTRRVALILGMLPAEIGGELYKLGEEIMTDAKDEYVPVDQGILRGSGFVNEPVVETAQISVTLGFGGAAEAYALKQHEDLSLHHPPKDTGHDEHRLSNMDARPNAGSKYLERPVLAKAHLLPERCGAIVARVYAEAGSA